MERPQIDDSKILAENCFIRKARKPHRCWGRHHAAPDCTKQIKPGDYCVECVDSTPMYQTGDYYCLPCAKLDGGPLGGVVLS